ncbi:hypothetical protein B0T16DRAFT_489025 [Cercophora newfieldiana]|uniref:Uncharacterized protein n=1 Tax=Cercophora newfieldiana TaxID=92897 RepID=A0AA40D164_9PEZI|nr:hypothetical protein B0T16DRAFT_489025 [Cercophora newfieldiana]
MNSYNSTTSAPEGTFGPHTSRLANAADPRVDSDRDGRAAGAGVGAPTHAPTTNTGITSTAGPTPGSTGENTGERVARGIKGVVAQGHGMTESLRGNINSGIDSLVGDTEKLPRDEAIARAGDREVLNKEFEKKGTVHKNFN